MTPEEFRKQNELTYDDYDRVRTTYGHIGSFAYWPKGFAFKPDETIPIVAADKEDFNARLRGHLQKGVVILGTNYGDRPYTPANDILEDQKLSVAARQAKLDEFYNLNNQYGGNNVKRAFSPEFETHNGKVSILSGAYMTDLFKFNPDEDGKWLATGMATKTETQLKDYLKDHPEAVDYNIAGLQHELHDVLGAGEQIVFVLLGGMVQGFASRLQKAFPEALMFDFYHYAAWQIKAEAFQAKGKALNDEVEAAIAKW